MVIPNDQAFGAQPVNHNLLNEFFRTKARKLLGEGDFYQVVNAIVGKQLGFFFKGGE